MVVEVAVVGTEPARPCCARVPAHTDVLDDGFADQETTSVDPGDHGGASGLGDRRY